MKFRLTKSTVRELLEYDPETGVFLWKQRGLKWFANKVDQARWNGRFAGKPAFTTVRKEGYLVGTLLRQDVFAHRLAFLWMTGKIPKYVEPVDGNWSNTRWANLTVSSPAKFRRKMALRNDNVSGTPGVWFETRTSKWLAMIGTGDGKRKGLGRFATKEEAIAARQVASDALGYHANHGRSR